MISYKIAKPGNVKLAIFRGTGHLVKTLVNKFQPVVEYSIEWDASEIPSDV
jgi:hypothetical protein